MLEKKKEEGKSWAQPRQRRRLRKRGAWWCQVPESRLLGPGRPGAAPALAVQAAGGSPAWPWLCERSRAPPGAQRALDPLRLWMGVPAPALVVAATLWQPRRSPCSPRPAAMAPGHRPPVPPPPGPPPLRPMAPSPARPTSQGNPPAGRTRTRHAYVTHASSEWGSALLDRPSAGLPAGRARTISLGVFDLGGFGAPVGGGPSGLPLRLCRCCPSPVRPESG